MGILILQAPILIRRHAAATSFALSDSHFAPRSDLAGHVQPQSLNLSCHGEVSSRSLQWGPGRRAAVSGFFSRVRLEGITGWLTLSTIDWDSRGFGCGSRQGRMRVRRSLKQELRTWSP